MSYEQRKYYFGVIIGFICDYKGWTQTETHRWIKDTWDIDTTTTMNTIEFEELAENIRQHCKTHWALPEGLIIPLPESL